MKELGKPKETQDIMNCSVDEAESPDDSLIDKVSNTDSFPIDSAFLSYLNE